MGVTFHIPRRHNHMANTTIPWLFSLSASSYAKIMEFRCTSCSVDGLDSITLDFNWLWFPVRVSHIARSFLDDD